MDTLNKREDVVRKTITHAYFSYAFIELSQRFGRKCKIANKTGGLDESILGSLTFLKQYFSQFLTAKHKCDKPGCESVLIVDRGCTPQRELFGEKLNGFTSYEEAGLEVITAY